MPRILVIADLGQHNYHVGDEAMGIATAAELTRRGFEVFIATRDTSHSELYIGGAAGYIKALSFPWSPAERELYLEQVRAHLAGVPADPEITRFVAEVSGMDGIVIAGGGNMNSTYGWLLYERAAYALVARSRRIPLLVSGQSLGPVLTHTDAKTLEELLGSAQLIGMREPKSYNWVLENGFSAHHIVDDATFYQPLKRSLPGRPTLKLPENYICATFTDLTPHQARMVGQLLDDMHRDYSLQTVFLPHMGNPDEADGDAALHAQIAEHMFSSPILLPIVHADDAVQVHRGAFINLSSRYHPGVFSLSAGVPFVALLPNAFTDMRVRGMMSHYGAENYAIPLVLLNTEAPAGALHEVIRLRNELSETLLRRTEELRAFSANWWDVATHLLTRGTLDGAPGLATLTDTPTSFTGDWNVTNLLVRDDVAELSLAAAQGAAESERSRSWDYQHTVQRDQAQARVAELEREKAELNGPLTKPQQDTSPRSWWQRMLG